MLLGISDGREVIRSIWLVFVQIKITFMRHSRKKDLWYDMTSFGQEVKILKEHPEEPFLVSLFLYFQNIFHNLLCFMVCS